MACDPQDLSEPASSPLVPSRELSPVHIGPQILGRIIVDHQLHTLHINATGSRVRAHQPGSMGGWELVGTPAGHHRDTLPPREAFLDKGQGLTAGFFPAQTASGCPSSGLARSGRRTQPRSHPQKLAAAGRACTEKTPQMGVAQAPPAPPTSHRPHLCEFSRELVKHRTLESFLCRSRCRMTSGLNRRRQGT